jgi:hypothetical protein
MSQEQHGPHQPLADRWLSPYDPVYNWGRRQSRSVRDCMIAWTPAFLKDPMAGQVEVGPHPDPYENGWSMKYLMTSGACWCDWRRISEVELQTRLLDDFRTMVVQDGLDPQIVHRTLFVLEEYRAAIANDRLRSPYRSRWYRLWTSLH